MKIEYHRQFVKHYKQRISPKPALERKFKDRLQLFVKSPVDPQLKDHGLTGKKRDYRAFWVTGDVRVVYRQEGIVLRLYDIGKHSQVY